MVTNQQSISALDERVTDCVPVTHGESTALAVWTAGTVLQENQSRLISTEDWVTNRLVCRTERRTCVVLQVDVEKSTASLGAVDKSEAIRHMPPPNADHPKVIGTPDGLTG